MAIASVEKRKRFTQNQIPAVAGIIKHYKSIGYKVVDGNETILISEPGCTFRIFISRISHCLQFYYLGEPDSTLEFYTKNLDSAGHIVEEERKYKEEFG
jgi:hypothetical protein